MINLFGTGIGKHIAIGRAYVLQGYKPSIEQKTIEPDQVNAEIKRLQKALARARHELNKNKEQIPEESPIEAQTIIDAHLLMLNDPMLVDETIHLIQNDLCSAETAVDKNAQSLMAIFNAMDDPYLRSKTNDVNHLTNLILRALLNIKDHSLSDVQQDLLTKKIIVSSDIGPSEAVHLTNKKIASFITDLGGPISHTALIAKSMSIPAIVGMENATQFIRDNDLLVIDAEQGSVLVNPDEATIAAYKKRRNRLKQDERELKRLIENHCAVRQGLTIELLANIEQPREIKYAKKVQADGIGLFLRFFVGCDCCFVWINQNRALFGINNQ